MADPTRCPVCRNEGRNRTCHPAEDAVSRRNLSVGDPRVTAAPTPLMTDTLPCVFVPAHEPWSCSTHPGGIRTSLDVDRCARVIPAHLEAVGAWSVESGDDDHNPWVLRDGQRIAEVWGPDDIGSEADARLIVDALNATARQPAPEGGLRAFRVVGRDVVPARLAACS